MSEFFLNGFHSEFELYIVLYVLHYFTKAMQ